MTLWSFELKQPETLSIKEATELALRNLKIPDKKETGLFNFQRHMMY